MAPHDSHHETQPAPIDAPPLPVASSRGSGLAPVLAALGAVLVAGFLWKSAPSGPVATNSTTEPVATASAAASPTAPVATSFSPSQRAEFEALIKDYLLRNPEVMMDVQTALETKMEKVNAEKMAVSLKENAKEIFQSATAPVAGNAQGDITVVEFFDYNCGYCKKAFPDLAAVMQADKNVRVVLKEFPILSKGSEEAAKIALAAKLQGKYWEFHQAMLGLQGQANEASSLKVAEKVGLDMARVKKDMASADVKKEIDDTRALAQKMGITGTPHFLVGDKVIAGAPENLSEVIANNIADLRKNGGCKVCGG